MAIRNVDQLPAYIASLASKTDKAKALALVDFMLIVEASARKNATKQFIGRNQRTLSGLLLSRIFVEIDRSDKEIKGYVGTRGIPYGRIHEEGGTIVPVNRKYLWIKSSEHNAKGSEFRRLTPQEFYDRHKARMPGYFYGRSKRSGKPYAGYSGATKTTVLFNLLKKVNIPARPYLSPAVDDNMSHYSRLLNKYLKLEVKK
jgi:phage gpG-like protein